MIPDIRVDASTWQDLYDLSGFDVGDALLITNKSPASTPIVWLGATAPTEDPASQPDGEPLLYGQQYYVTAGQAGCWVHCGLGQFGRVGLQVQLAE